MAISRVIGGKPFDLTKNLSAFQMCERVEIQLGKQNRVGCANRFVRSESSLAGETNSLSVSPDFDCQNHRPGRSTRLKDADGMTDLDHALEIEIIEDAGYSERQCADGREFPHKRIPRCVLLCRLGRKKDAPHFKDGDTLELRPERCGPTHPARDRKKTSAERDMVFIEWIT